MSTHCLSTRCTPFDHAVYGKGDNAILVLVLALPLPFPPLPPATLKLLVQLDGGEEGLVMVAEARRKAKGGKSPATSYLDLKDDRSVPMQRTSSAGSLPHHSVGSTPSHTPQGTPGVPRRETIASTAKPPNKNSASTSALEGDATGKKTNSLPVNTPPPSKSKCNVVMTTTICRV